MATEPSRAPFATDEYADRLTRAAASLQALADEIAHDDSPEGRAYRATEGSTRRHARLLGKREGVLLALDYLRDYEPPPSSDRTTGGEPDGD